MAAAVAGTKVKGTKVKADICDTVPPGLPDAARLSAAAHLLAALPDPDSGDAVKTIWRILHGVLAAPQEAQKRRVKKGNKSFHQKVGRFAAAVDFLRAAGFVDDTDLDGHSCLSLHVAYMPRLVDAHFTLARAVVRTGMVAPPLPTLPGGSQHQGKTSIKTQAAKRDAPEPGCHYVLIGNPGVGKSTLLNGFMKRVAFQSGISFVGGLTQVLQLVTTEEGAHFLDTPGLNDVDRKEEAAREISEALRQGAKYKICFVVVLDAGRVRADDVTTVKLVLDAVPSVKNWGLIINKIPEPTHATLLPGGQNFEILRRGLERLLGRTDFDMHCLKKVTQLEDQNNQVMDLPPDLQSFVFGLPTQDLRREDVLDVSIDAYDALKKEFKAMQDEYEKHIAHVWEDSQKMVKAIDDLQKQVDDQQKKAEVAQAETARRETQIADQQASIQQMLLDLEQQKLSSAATKHELEQSQKRIEELRQQGADKSIIDNTLKQMAAMQQDHQKEEETKKATEKKLEEMESAMAESQKRHRLMEEETQRLEEAAERSQWEKEAMEQRMDRMRRQLDEAQKAKTESIIPMPLGGALQADWSIRTEEVRRLFGETSGEKFKCMDIDMIDNKSLRLWVSAHLKIVDQRVKSEPALFAPDLPEDPHPNKRGLLEMLDSWCETQSDGANVVLAWHGAPSEAAAQGIAQLGFAALSNTDPGYFGRGRYMARESEYACRYATGELGAEPVEQSEQGWPVLLVAGIVGSAYPVTQCERDFTTVYSKSARDCRFFGMPLKPRFDTHIIAVDAEHDFLCSVKRLEGAGIFHEFVFDQDAQLLPLAIVWFTKQ